MTTCWVASGSASSASLRAGYSSCAVVEGVAEKRVEAPWMLSQTTCTPLPIVSRCCCESCPQPVVCTPYKTAPYQPDLLTHLGDALGPCAVGAHVQGEDRDCGAQVVEAVVRPAQKGGGKGEDERKVGGTEITISSDAHDDRVPSFIRFLINVAPQFISTFPLLHNKTL